MSREKKIVRFLREANGMEEARTDVLTSQLAMTPRGAYRKTLQLHLRETRDHAKRVRTRLGQLDHGRNPIELGVGVLQNVAGQALGLGRMPFELLRGCGLSNSKVLYVHSLAAHFLENGAKIKRWPLMEDEAIIAKFHKK